MLRKGREWFFKQSLKETTVLYNLLHSPLFLFSFLVEWICSSGVSFFPLLALQLNLMMLVFAAKSQSLIFLPIFFVSLCFKRVLRVAWMVNTSMRDLKGKWSSYGFLVMDISQMRNHLYYTFLPIENLHLLLLRSCSQCASFSQLKEEKIVGKFSSRQDHTFIIPVEVFHYSRTCTWLLNTMM